MTVVGIDVGGERKGFHGCAIDGERIVAGPQAIGGVEAAVDWVAWFEPTTIAIDSPCEAAPAGTKARPDEVEFNRAGICGIRFTPPLDQLAGNPYYAWIVHGLRLYEALATRLPGTALIETFPTAAWTIWHEPRGKQARGAWSQDAFDSLGLAGAPARRLSQDDRDAVAAALVAHRHEEGETTAYGKIIVPAASRP
jgi:predicted nuclease with RNAse H fold